MQSKDPAGLDWQRRFREFWPEPQAARENAFSDHLEAASHDYQGHRVDAIHAIDEAIHQLDICMKYD